VPFAVARRYRSHLSPSLPPLYIVVAIIVIVVLSLHPCRCRSALLRPGCYDQGCLEGCVRCVDRLLRRDPGLLTRVSSVRGGDVSQCWLMSGWIMTLRFGFIAVVVGRIPGLAVSKRAVGTQGSSFNCTAFSLFSEFTVHPPLGRLGRKPHSC
jgi:hypothetical protein